MQPKALRSARPTRGSAAFSTAAVALATCGAAWGQAVSEIEPNDSKSLATPAVLAPGGSVTGTTTGSSTTTPGGASADYFLIRTTPAPLGIYRYELALTSATPGQTLTIRGLNQVGGVIGTADVALQTSSASTTPPRIVSWDGFGREERLYVRITGTGATTAPYTLTLMRTPIVPMSVTDTIFAGIVRISVIGDADTEFVVYDSSFSQVDGNDDDLDPMTASSRVGDYDEGVYYIKIGAANIATAAPAGPGEANLSGSVTDFENLAVGSAWLLPTRTLLLKIEDDLNPPSDCLFDLQSGKVNEGKWVCIPLPPKGSCCLSIGECLITTEAQCSAAGGLFTPEGACVPNPCIMSGSGACCEGSTCTIRPAPACTGPGTRYIGDGVMCNPVGNDVSPCCRSDFNQSGTITVQDIFDFLGAYFSADPRANYNGGPLGVQDLFDFLAGYFEGC